MRTAEEVLALYRERAKVYAPLHAAMHGVQAIYDGKTKIDLPEHDQVVGSTVPNLLAQGVDQMAGRIAGITPMVFFAPEDQNSRASVRRAVTAKRVLQGWWQMDRMKKSGYQRARHLIAYGLAPAVIRWDAKEHRPVWDVRSPLETFASPETRTGSTMPADVIFAYKRSVGYLVAQGWETKIREVTGNGSNRLNHDDTMLLLEYVDEDGRMLCLAGWVGRHDPNMPAYFYPQGSEKCVALTASLMNYPCMTASVPTRLMLTGPQGQFNSMVGMYYTQVRLMALQMAAIEKGIFPDTYLESRPNEVGRFIDGPHDGRTGKVNIVAGGAIREINTTPGYMTDPMVQTLERNQRVTAGIPQEFGGESGTNIRTGRRGDAVLSAVIDFPVAECQDTLAYALTDENKAAIALAKMYDGSAPRTIYVGTGNQVKPINYVADKVFTHDAHVVAYPVSGTDITQFMIGLGQRVGMGTMSLQTAAELDPFIADPEREHDRKQVEGLEAALMSGLQQAAAAPAGSPGALPAVTLAKIIQMIGSDKMEIADAMVKVAEDAAALAAQQAPPEGTESVPPSADQMAAPGAAQALTGSAPPGPGPTQGQTDIAGLFNALRKPVRTVVPAANAAQGGV